ncbi:MAG: hypothetical protein HY791_08470 [Deltaproteobacteria bacterium]|nr:hypothetical protein [Deltaproteobacteria bacterium]
MRRSVALLFLAACGPTRLGVALPPTFSDPAARSVLLFEVTDGQARLFHVDPRTREGLPPVLDPEFQDGRVELYAFRYDRELSLPKGPLRRGVRPFARSLPTDFSEMSHTAISGGVWAPWGASSVPAEVSDFEIARERHVECPSELARDEPVAVGDGRSITAAVLLDQRRALFLIDEQDSADDVAQAGRWYIFDDRAVVATGTLAAPYTTVAKLPDGTLLLNGECSRLGRGSIRGGRLATEPLTVTGTTACPSPWWHGRSGWLEAVGSANDFVAYSLSKYGVLLRYSAVGSSAHVEELWRPDVRNGQTLQNLDRRGGLVVSDRDQAIVVARVEESPISFKEGQGCLGERVCRLPAPYPGDGITTIEHVDGVGTLVGGRGWAALDAAATNDFTRLEQLSVDGFADLRSEGFAGSINAFAHFRAGFAFGASEGEMGTYVLGHGFCPYEGRGGHTTAPAPHHVLQLLPWGDELLAVTDEVPGLSPARAVVISGKD